MVTKKKVVEKEIEVKTVEKHKPFLEKGYVFQTENKTKWLINFDVIPQIINNFFEQYMNCLNKNYGKYENWFNYNFNNECICPSIFIDKSDMPIFIKR